MNEESKIQCPHCGKELSSSIFEDHFKKELENLGSREKEFKEKEKTILADAKKKAEEQAQTNLKEKEKKIEEEAFKKAKKQAQKELKEKAIIEAKKEVVEENEDIKRKYKALEVNYQRLHQDLTKANKKISQGSSELQGEVQEKLIEDFLREKFPDDSIEEVKKKELEEQTVYTI